MQQQLERVKELKLVLMRLGARPAARYYASPVRVFLVNGVGGAVAGAALSLLGALLLLIDARRGADSALFHVLHAIGMTIQAIRAMIERELA